MSTICDSCKQGLREDDGCARIMITNPSVDYATLSPEDLHTLHRRSLTSTLDLCATCLMKMIASLSLPPDTFTPRPPRAEPADSTPVGALTEEDLVKLGLKESP